MSRVAKVKRKAAITNEGAPSVCAKRIKILAVETARVATINAMGRRKRVRESIMPPSVPEKQLNLHSIVRYAKFSASWN